MTSFYDRVTHSADEGKAVGGCYVLDSRKAFDTASLGIHLEKMAAGGLDGCAVHWPGTCLDG